MKGIISTSLVWNKCNRIFFLDFGPLFSTMVILEPMSNRSCFRGFIVNDQIGLEGMEAFTIRLVDPQMSNVLTRNVTTIVNIIDDDGK